MTDQKPSELKACPRYKVGALPNRWNSCLMIEGDDDRWHTFYPTVEETKQLADDFKYAYVTLTGCTRSTDLTPSQLSHHIQMWKFDDSRGWTFAEYLMAKFPNGIRIVPNEGTEKEDNK